MSGKSVFDQHPIEDRYWLDWARDIERLSIELGWNVKQLTEEGNPTRVQLRNDMHADPVPQEAHRRNEDIKRVEMMHRIFVRFPTPWRIAVAAHYLDGREPGTIATKLGIDRRHVAPMFVLIFRETKLQRGIERHAKIVQGDERLTIAAMGRINSEHAKLRTKKSAA